MSRPSRASALLAPGIALATLLALSACDRRDDAAVADVENPPPASTQPAPSDVQDADGVIDGDVADRLQQDPNAAVTVTGVELGNEVGADNRVAAPMTTFAGDDTIHASVVTDGSGGTVSTRWTFEDGQVVHTEDKRVPAGEQVTDFMVTNPAGWPDGRYTLEVSVDGQVVDRREYAVR